MSVFILKRGDTRPPVKVQLFSDSGGTVNLTGCTVRFKMRKPDQSTLKVNAAATIVDATSGIVQYSCTTIDTDTAGLFQAEFEVTYPDDGIETHPDNGYLAFCILVDL